ncbi:MULTISPECIES: class I SAM-dependent methyltransferase [unclassified Rhizobium]|uniref:class I SAM-dependent methyltransferase n=1 Tax=unclassified Rhizobium TaxID=2613769 RepID=UPI001FD9E744|nr:MULTISPECIES: class I SAM-dependent methyltransferase [unclassified Rhizobium]MBP2462075.1 SAM-dependent methyltransferase [Rhizobium sp. PvP014]
MTYPNGTTVKRPRNGAGLLASYYQDLHEGNDAYRENNWLTSELNEILSISGNGRVVEIGCGNGQFTAIIAPHVAVVHAFDWAKSDYMEAPPENVTFHHGDVRIQPIPQADVVCSADVLEHFAPTDLAPVVAKFCSAGAAQHHVIACYDDGHSHLTVMPPSAWLALFKRFCPTAYIQRIECRRNNAEQLVCVISTKPTTCNFRLEVGAIQASTTVQDPSQLRVDETMTTSLPPLTPDIKQVTRNLKLLQLLLEEFPDASDKGKEKNEEPRNENGVDF